MTHAELPQGTRPELITKVPFTTRQELGAGAATLTALITEVPGVETSHIHSPEDAVAAINAQLAARDSSLGTPEVRVGKIIAQRGGNPVGR